MLSGPNGGRRPADVIACATHVGRIAVRDIPPDKERRKIPPRKQPESAEASSTEPPCRATAGEPCGKSMAKRPVIFLVLSLLMLGCGESGTPTTSAPAPPPPAPPPPPPGPSLTSPPTGLTISSSTAHSITWIWNAVEGATTYAVQVSMTGTFFEALPLVLVNERTYTVSNLRPGTTVSLRIATATDTTLGRLSLSEWSAPITGMTTPPPEPEPVAGGTCVAGGILWPGEYCTYPGTANRLAIRDDGSAHFLSISSETSISLVSATINGRIYTLVVKRQADGSWLIEEIGEIG